MQIRNGNASLIHPFPISCHFTHVNTESTPPRFYLSYCFTIMGVLVGAGAIRSRARRVNRGEALRMAQT